MVRESGCQKDCAGAEGMPVVLHGELPLVFEAPGGETAIRE